MPVRYDRWGDEEPKQYVSPGTKVCPLCGMEFSRKSTNERNMIYNVHMSEEGMFGQEI